MLSKFLFLTIITQTIASTNIYNSCKKCISYIKPSFNDKYEIGNYFGKCNKFVNNDTLIGDFDYKYALQVRLNENECGKEGKYFIEGEPVNSIDIPSL
jgi:hypothetical protein